MTTAQKLGIALLVAAYVLGTVYVKLGKPGTIAIAIVGAILLVFDEPTNAQ